MSAKTRVMLVDDHALCRSGLTELLEHRGNMTVVAASGEPAQALQQLHALRPELLVLDMRLGKVDGLSVLRQMRGEGLDTPVVMLTMSDSEEDMAAALRAGVRGYLLKDAMGQAVAVLVGGTSVGILLAAGLGAIAAQVMPVVVDVSTTVVPAAGLIALGLIGAALSVRKVTSVDPHAALAAR